jgi:hypothetical protein
MNRSDRYVVSFQSEHCRKGVVRYHWMICLAHKPDELVSWGHAETLELAEKAARNELNDLHSGLTRGGKVSNRLSRRGVGLISP